jgi:hypothetical protein
MGRQGRPFAARELTCRRIDDSMDYFNPKIFISSPVDTQFYCLFREASQRMQAWTRGEPQPRTETLWRCFIACRQLSLSVCPPTIPAQTRQAPIISRIRASPSGFSAWMVKD